MKKQKKKKMGPPPVSFSSHKQTNKPKASKQASKPQRSPSPSSSYDDGSTATPPRPRAWINPSCRSSSFVKLPRNACRWMLSRSLWALGQEEEEKEIHHGACATHIPASSSNMKKKKKSSKWASNTRELEEAEAEEEEGTESFRKTEEEPWKRLTAKSVPISRWTKAPIPRDVRACSLLAAANKTDLAMMHQPFFRSLCELFFSWRLWNFSSLLFPSLSITENASLVATHIHTPKVRTVF